MAREASLRERRRVSNPTVGAESALSQRSDCCNRTFRWGLSRGSGKSHHPTTTTTRYGTAASGRRVRVSLAKHSLFRARGLPDPILSEPAQAPAQRDPGGSSPSGPSPPHAPPASAARVRSTQLAWQFHELIFYMYVYLLCPCWIHK